MKDHPLAALAQSRALPPPMLTTASTSRMAVRTRSTVFRSGSPSTAAKTRAAGRARTTASAR